MNFSNFVEEQIDQNWLQQIMNFIPKNCLNEINDTSFRLNIIGIWLFSKHNLSNL